jgi:hypothetical protein
MELKDWIPIAGWAVTFGLGVLSGGFIIPRLTAKRKIIDWAVLSENELIPKELSQVLGVPVVIQVGLEQPISLSTVHLRVRGGGNETIENVAVRVNFIADSKVLNIRPIHELGEYGQYVQWVFNQNSCRIEMQFLNPDAFFDLEILLSDYTLSSITVDAAAPGVRVRRKDALQLNLPTSVFGKLLSGLTLDLMGIRYDPSAEPMRQIVQELRELRQQLRG